LVAQRLMGVVELDGFDVSHTKDAILFKDDEQEKLEGWLVEHTKAYRDYASRRRNEGERGKPWTREKVKDLIEGMKKEFTTGELRDAAQDLLPPLDTILANNKKQVEALRPDEHVESFNVTPDLKVVVSLQERSEYEPYVTITAGAEHGTIHVIINNLHPTTRRSTLRTRRRSASDSISTTPSPSFRFPSKPGKSTRTRLGGRRTRCCVRRFYTARILSRASRAVSTKRSSRA
jgi:hypothetical protein